MKTKPTINALSVAILIAMFVVFSRVGNAGDMGSTPGIEGTYKLVLRELPDGKQLRHPDVVGYMTYTKKYRNFNIYWKNTQGKAFSISYVASYDLNDKEYSEKSIYYLENNEIDGKPIKYDLTGPTGSSPVTRKDGRVEFQLPLYGEPFGAFEGTKFTASRKGAFVDHWEKVK
ncbi:MAG: hypothetical protein GTN76_15470 [Candidatus Aenigmarchaeota archaeon]|nr:hypothetical protein [Candidatus Aenigmarchaeota archaeon]